MFPADSAAMRSGQNELFALSLRMWVGGGQGDELATSSPGGGVSEEGGRRTAAQPRSVTMTGAHRGTPLLHARC